MNAEGVEIMTALQMITAVAQRYLANQAGTSHVVSNPCNDKKRKFENNKSNSWGKKKGTDPQVPQERQGKVSDPAATAPIISAPRVPYAGNLPKCNKCSYHHNGACKVFHCTKCNKKGHTTRYCRTPTLATTQTANISVVRTCYECGEAGHFKRDCPKAKSKHGEVKEGVLTMGVKEARNTMKTEEST